MTDQFQFSLTDQEKQALKDLVRLSIASRLFPQQGIQLPDAPSGKLQEPLGAFVTLHLDQRLRGCIGHLVGDAPLWETIADMAQAAAFQDPRFSPLGEDEFERLELEISILSPLTRCSDPALVEIGRHGLLIRHGGHSGLLLPQVPVEWQWDREQFLAQTCRKAGLPPTAWRDPQSVLFWFEAEVF
ncbi:MAG: AmmeMemoRadiSam system protein A [Proteobacteria bacterium]|nr:AmmeMemoRadiSam system protein A [Pseudomonadota bacterium]